MTTDTHTYTCTLEHKQRCAETSTRKGAEATLSPLDA